MKNNILNLINDKVILLNAGALSITFMDVQEILKILVLVTSLIYTSIRLYRELNKKNQKTDEI